MMTYGDDHITFLSLIKIAIQGPGGIRDHARGAGATLCTGAKWLEV